MNSFVPGYRIQNFHCHISPSSLEGDTSRPTQETSGRTFDNGIELSVVVLTIRNVEVTAMDLKSLEQTLSDHDLAVLINAAPNFTEGQSLRGHHDCILHVSEKGERHNSACCNHWWLNGGVQGNKQLCQV